MRYRAVCGWLLLPALFFLALPRGQDAPAPPEVIAFAAVQKGVANLYLIRPDGTHRRQVLRDGRDPAFSPDGQALFFARGRDIYSVRRDGSGLRRWTHHPPGIAVSDPVLSEDRTILLFNATPAAANAVTTIRLLRTDGSGEQTIANDGRDPSFTPDQVRILFARGGAVYSMSRNSMAGPPFTPGVMWQARGNARVRAPLFGPGDFAGLVFAARTLTPGAPWSLQAVRYGGEQPRQVTLATNAAQPAFRPDGKEIAFVREGNLYRMRADGSHLARLTRGPGAASHPAWWMPGR